MKLNRKISYNKPAVLWSCHHFCVDAVGLHHTPASLSNEDVYHWLQSSHESLSDCRIGRFFMLVDTGRLMNCSEEMIIHLELMMKICQHLKQSHGLKSRLEVNEHSLDVHGMTARDDSRF